MLSKEDGKRLIELARNAVRAYLESEDIKVSDELKERFREKRGVFVTIKENGELRGCIGFIEPVYSLWQGVVRAALGAAFADPRFMPITKEEFKDLKFEVSVLTEPELIEEPYEDKIEIGKHGLIVEKDGFKGLLLPQVAPEFNWDKKEFLEHTCLKAGLSKDAYRDKDVRVYRFECEIFSE